MRSDTKCLFKSPVEIKEPPRNGNIAREILETLKRNSRRTLIVDATSGRQWTGAAILERCAGIATCLVSQVGVQVNDVVMTICDRDETELLAALGIILSGATLYPTMPVDGYHEAYLLCELVQPRVLVVNSKYRERAQKLCQNVPGMKESRIVCIDNLGSCSNGECNGAEQSQTLDENNNGTNFESPSARCGQTIVLDNSQIRQHCNLKLVESIANEEIRGAEHNVSLLLTSGSTGRPKLVVITHEEQLWSVYAMRAACTIPFRRKSPLALDANNNNVDSDSSVDDFILQLGSNDVVAGDLPLDHGAGLCMMFLSLSMGAKFIVMPSFDVDQFWQVASDHKISFSLTSVAFGFSLFKQLKQRLEEGTAHKLDLSSLHNIYVCGAKMTYTDLVDEVRTHYPNLRVSQSYGCTEAGYISTLAQRDIDAGFIESVGFLFPGVVAKVVDPNDLNRRLGPNQRGELLIFTRSLFRSYRCHPEVDADEVFRNCHDPELQFYRTGDQVHFDEEGRLYVHGRYKDTLVLAGDWKIMPAELEEVANEHPLVEASAVVGIPDPESPTCHLPRAFVKLVDESEACRRKEERSTQDAQVFKEFEAGNLKFVASHIEEFVAARVAPAKRLAGGVRILEELPRVGLLNKIDRQALRKMS